MTKKNILRFKLLISIILLFPFFLCIISQGIESWDTWLRSHLCFATCAICVSGIAFAFGAWHTIKNAGEILTVD